MKKLNWLILTVVVLLTALPLWLVPHLGVGFSEGPSGQQTEVFRGSDDKAQQAIGEISPGYKPWFSSLLAPASPEISSLLFALQAAIGAGVIGYWLGCAVTRDRLRRETQSKEFHAD